MAAQEPFLGPSATNTICYTLRCLLDEVRPGQRTFMNYRGIHISFNRTDGRASAEVQLGRTRVICEVVARVSEPYPDRPLEGFLIFNVELTSMSSGAAEAGKNSPAATEIARMLERQIRDARAIDIESLCIRPGASVWGIRCDTRVLEDDGNLLDASALATMAALLHFRRADVSVEGSCVTVHSFAERAPLPLSVHHVPLSVTFGLFGLSSFAPLAAAVSAGVYPAPPDGRPTAPAAPIIILDPTKCEEVAGGGSATFVVNAHNEVCGIHKVGGCPLTPAAIVQCAKVASEKAVQLVGLLRDALNRAEREANEKLVSVHSVSWAPLRGTMQVDSVGSTGGTAARADKARVQTVGILADGCGKAIRKVRADDGMEDEDIAVQEQGGKAEDEEGSQEQYAAASSEKLPIEMEYAR